MLLGKIRNPLTVSYDKAAAISTVCIFDWNSQNIYIYI